MLIHKAYKTLLIDGKGSELERNGSEVYKVQVK